MLLCLLAGCTADKTQMLQQLETLEQQNHQGELMLNDSLAESLVDFFDRNGNANERMRSRYILGRTYYCLGELPRALDTYNDAIGCADTTSDDCDFAKLSRIYAQKAQVFNLQVQPRSQQNELRRAEYYAMKGRDTLMAIECYALQAQPYGFLHNPDSVIIVTEKAYELFRDFNRLDRSYQVIGNELPALVDNRHPEITKQRITEYENKSGFFDERGNIKSGLEVYYYYKGCYYISIQNLDSAEILFRKELRDGKDLNNQIAGSKGLQKLYEQRRIPDSIAKYANLGYLLNDSAYSLSEMQNIQKFQASYNYNHQKQLAEQSQRDAERTKIIFICFAVILLLFGGGSFALYRSKKLKKLEEYRQNLDALGKIQSEIQELCGEDTNVPALIARKNEEICQLQTRISAYQKRQTDREKASLDDRLTDSEIVRHLNDLLKENPVRQAGRDDLRKLTYLLNEQIPMFYNVLNTTVVLRPVEYEICMLIRCHFKPAAIAKLLGFDEAYVSNSRRRLLSKIYGVDGHPKDMDIRIMAIS